MRTLITLLVVLTCSQAFAYAHASDKDGWDRKHYTQADRFQRAERADRAQQAQREREARINRTNHTYERRVRENVRYENNENRRSGWSSERDLQRNSSPTYDRYRDQNR